jgi:hypothetical protein
MQYNAVTDLVYADFEKTKIDCAVAFVDAGILLFTADKNDLEPHGREIFERAVAGEFGEIGEYVAPVTAEIDIITLGNQQRAIRTMILEELDRVVSNPLRWAELSDADRQDYARYRQELLDIPQQDQFPTNVTWPTPPARFVPSNSLERMVTIHF